VAETVVAQDGVQWRAAVNAVLKLCVSHMVYSRGVKTAATLVHCVYSLLCRLHDNFGG
jgi:hypothetical protein